MAILVTGGAGYIGSHTVFALLQRGEEVIVLDNLCNATQESIHRAGRLAGKPAIFYQGDIRDYALLCELFTRHAISAVIHFAALKAVGASVQQPLAYYDNNVAGTLTLLRAMCSAQVWQLVFSSSATVYGTKAPVPYVESAPIGNTTSPYGTSKVMIEQLLQDLAIAEPRFISIALRYFNPIGAHPSGEMGEDPHGIPNNLLPYIAQVAVGRQEKLAVYGDDYPTADGTCQRDYIHVMDLAMGHLQALDRLPAMQGFKAYNLGAGKAYSVLEIIKAFEQAAGRPIPYEIKPRRAGDLAAFWADATLAASELNWRPRYTLEQMMRDTWHWQVNNSQGYSA